MRCVALLIVCGSCVTCFLKQELAVPIEFDQGFSIVENVDELFSGRCATTSS